MLVTFCSALIDQCANCHVACSHWVAVLCARNSRLLSNPRQSRHPRLRCAGGVKRRFVFVPCGCMELWSRGVPYDARQGRCCCACKAVLVFVLALNVLYCNGCCRCHSDMIERSYWTQTLSPSFLWRSTCLLPHARSSLRYLTPCSLAGLGSCLMISVNGSVCRRCRSTRPSEQACHSSVSMNGFEV